MMSVVSNENHEQGPNEIRTYCADFRTKLRETEYLTGTPTVAELVTTDLTITNKAVLAAEFTDTAGNVIPAGKGVTYTISGVQVNADDTDKNYRINVYCDTNFSERPQIYCRITGTKSR
jgi:hypothetical protein